ncbi:MAG: tktC [Segetibacter sp.]|nr:tktC [Segetibacter sp.]
MSEMEKNESIFFLTADMGINLVEKIEKKFPKRFANVGIAEQNLIGVASGLANQGFRPFVYTISNFVIHRCYEQIRNDVVLHKYPITLMGTSTGYDNAPLGPTHHIIDDWGALRNIPNIDIYCPGSVSYARILVSKIIANNRPAYIRIPKGEFQKPDSERDMVLIEGNSKSTLLISYASPAQECIKAQENNPELSVLIFNKLRPVDAGVLQNILSTFDKLVVIEDHFASSGLYGMLCEFCMTHQIFKRIKSIAPTDYIFEVGRASNFFHEKIGFVAEKLQNL